MSEALRPPLEPSLLSMSISAPQYLTSGRFSDQKQERAVLHIHIRAREQVKLLARPHAPLQLSREIVSSCASGCCLLRLENIIARCRADVFAKLQQKERHHALFRENNRVLGIIRHRSSRELLAPVFLKEIPAGHSGVSVVDSHLLNIFSEYRVYRAVILQVF